MSSIPPSYKMTEVSVIPKGWDVKPLGSVITLQRGFDLPHRNRREGSIPVVTSSGSNDTHNEAKVKAPGVVTGRYGTIGEVFFLTHDFWPHNTTLFVSDFKGNHPLFIYYLLHRIDFKTYSGKSGVPGINRNDLHEAMVYIPTRVSEQRAIADVLGEVDAQITALDALIAKKHDLKQGTMQRLLTGEERLPGFEHTPSYKRTEIGVIPEDWDVTILEALCEFENGDRGQNYPSKKEFVQTGVPFINAGHISDGYINQSEMDYISREKFEKLGGGKIAPGDILFCLRGSLGKFGVVTPGFGDGAIASSLVIIRPKSERVLREYLINYFGSAYCTQMIEQWAGGAAQPNLGARDLARFTVPLPTNSAEQQAIVAILADMDAEITALEAKREKTIALKQGMMQELLTGKTRLV